MKFVAAAIKLDGEVYTVPPPGRHDAVRRLMREQGKDPTFADDGFLNDAGVFIRRKPATHIALTTGLVKVLQNPPLLTTDDLW